MIRYGIPLSPTNPPISTVSMYACPMEPAIGPSPAAPPAFPVAAPVFDPLVRDAIRKGLATMSAEELRKYIERMYGIEEP